MFPHPCLQGVHLLVHKTREHSVCMDFRNFPVLHENGKKKSEAVAGQNGRLQCESRLEIKQHTSWQVSVLVSFGSLFPFLTVPPPSLSLSLTCMQTQRGCVSFPASPQGSSPNVKSIVLSLPSGDRVTSTHTSVGRYMHPHT